MLWLLVKHKDFVRKYLIPTAEKDKVSQRILCAAQGHQPRLPRHSPQELQGFGPPLQEKTLHQGDAGGSAWATSSHLDASISSFVNCVSFFFETDACHRVVPLFWECVTSQPPCVCFSGQFCCSLGQVACLSAGASAGAPKGLPCT